MFLAVHVEQFVLYRFGQIRACLIVDLHEREAEVDATHNPRGIGLIEEDPVAIGCTSKEVLAPETVETAMHISEEFW